MFDVLMRNVESRRGREEDETGRSGGALGRIGICELVFLGGGLLGGIGDVVGLGLKGMLMVVFLGRVGCCCC
jgi:hypothetical protein